MSQSPPAGPKSCADCGCELPPAQSGAVCSQCLWSDPDDSPAEHPAGVLPLRIPGHDVQAELARGGMGIVYRAWEAEAQRTVALKMLLPHLADEPGMRERFRLEARAAAGLDHPAVLPVYHIGVADDVPYFTMKLAEGGSLLERRGRYTGQWRAIAGLIAALAEAVQVAHSHGVLHRDLKPGNVLFDDQDRPYLSDFGLVKIVDSDSQLTRSRHFLGTPHYAAPEVAAASASEATTASDIWSLGAMLYELLAGRLPFEAPGIPALLRKVVDEPAPPLPPSVPRDLAVICRKCLEKSARQRFSSAGSLAADLRRWLEGRSISARPMSRMERVRAWARRNPALATLGTGLVAALAISAGALWRENAANVRALGESRRAEQISRQSENAALAAQAASLLEEARAIRRSGRLLDREAAIRAAQRSHSISAGSGARDELAAILTMPRAEIRGSLPYTRRWPPPLDAAMARYATLEDDSSVAVRETSTQQIVWHAAGARANPGQRPGPLSPDGRRLAVRTDTGTMVWEQGQEAPLLDLAGMRAEPRFSPDGRFFATGAFSLALHLADLSVTPPALRQCMDGATGWYPDEFSPDGKYLLCYQPSRFALRVLDVSTGQCKTECAPGRRVITDLTAAQCAAWSRTGNWFVAGTRDGCIARWTVGESLPDWVLPVHAGAVDALAIAGDDRLLVSQGRDGLVKFTSLLTLEAQGSVPWAGLALHVASDGIRLAVDHVEAKRMELLSCDAGLSAESGVLPPSRDSNPASAVRGGTRVIAWPDGSRFSVSNGADVSQFTTDPVLRSAGIDQIGRVYDMVLDFTSQRWLYRQLDHIVAAGPALPIVNTRPSGVLTRMADASMAYDPVSRRVLLGHRKGFSLYNFAKAADSYKPLRESVKPLKLVSDVELAVSAVAWSLDGKRIAWAGKDTRPEAAATLRGIPVLHVCDAVDGAEHCVIPLPESPHALAFTPDQMGVVSADAATIACHEITGARELWRHPHRRSPRAPAQLAAARAAPVFAATLDPHTVSLIDPATGLALLTLTYPQERTLQAFDLSPDGTQLLALSGSLVQLWRLDHLQEELNRLMQPEQGSATAAGAGH